MPVDLLDHQYGAWLVAKGWKIQPTDNARGGTAYVDWPARTIWMKRSAFNRPSVRVRRYVVTHEVAHAVHAETTGGQYTCDELQKFRGLNLRSAVEAVADAACLMLDPSAAMRTWVRASVTWHGHVGYRYGWSDVVHPVTRNTVLGLLERTRTAGDLL